MGLRNRMKSRLKRMLGRPASPSDASSSSTPPPQKAGRPVPDTPAPEPSPPSAPPPEAHAPAAAAPPQAATSAPSQSPPEPDGPPADEELQAAKAAHHFEKTRRAVLRFIDEQGGEAGLGEMHDYSERRYFVGHKRFSDLMEGLVAESLIDYDHGSGRATLTEAGRSLGHTPMPPRPRG